MIILRQLIFLKMLIEIVSSEHFNLTPAVIIETLDLHKPIYKPTATLKSFDLNDKTPPWQKAWRRCFVFCCDDFAECYFPGGSPLGELSAESMYLPPRAARVPLPAVRAANSL